MDKIRYSFIIISCFRLILSIKNFICFYYIKVIIMKIYNLLGTIPSDLEDAYFSLCSLFFC